MTQASEIQFEGVPSGWEGIAVNANMEVVAAAGDQVLVFDWPADKMRETADMLKRAARAKRRLEKAARP